MSPRNLLAALAALSLLGGCAAYDQLRSVFVTEVGLSTIGENAIGETCRAQRLPEPPEGAQEAYEVFCGQWETPSGRLYRAAGGDAAGLSSGGWWDARVAQGAICGAPAATTLAGEIPAVLRTCKLRQGGWDYVALAADTGAGTWVADGIPAFVPAVETALAIATGRQEAADRAVERSAAIDRLEGELGGRSFGQGDIETYDRLMELGRYYNSLKKYADAEAQYRDALAVHQRINGVDNPGAVDPIMHLALEVSNQGRFAEAERLFQRAGLQLEGSNDENLLARFQSYRAFHAANQRDFQGALTAARAATRIRLDLAGRAAELGIATGRQAEDAEGGVDVFARQAQAAAVDVVQSLYLEGTILMRLEQLDEADQFVADAQARLDQAGLKPDWWGPDVLELRAQILERRGRRAEAATTMVQAVQETTAVLGPTRPTCITWLNLAEIYERNQDPAAALDARRQGAAVCEREGETLAFDQVAPHFSLALARAEAAPAERDQLFAEIFRVGQLVRDGQTAKLVAEVAARLAATDRPEGPLLRAQQDAARKRLRAEAALAQETALPPALQDRTRIAALAQEVADRQAETAALELQVQAASPGYSLLTSAPVSLEEVLGLLQPQEAIVQVLVGERRSFGFVLRNGAITPYEIAIGRAELATQVQNLRAGLRALPNGRIPAFNAGAAARLYQTLYAPVEAQLADAAHVLVVAQGPLLSLPPAVLVTGPAPEGRVTDYRSVQYWVDRSALSLLPSVRTFVNLRKTAGQSGAERAFLGFGDFQPDPERAAASLAGEDCETDRRLLANLAPLPDTADELRAVAATFPGGADVELGPDFTQPDILAANAEGLLKQYRTIYFATHGLLPTELRCQARPALVVTPAPGGVPGDPATDGFLDNVEIESLELDADLIVLSACNTGGGGDAEGTTTGGESLTGLAQSFFYAGARAMLVSHWAVSSSDTVTLMTGAFAEIEREPGLGSAYALQRSQVALMRRSADRNRAHPFFWGPFTLVGDGARTVGPAATTQGAEAPGARAGLPPG